MKRFFPLGFFILCCNNALLADIIFVGNQDDVESAANTPTSGWRNPDPIKPLDIDGDHILGTDGHAIFNNGNGPKLFDLPTYISSVDHLSNFSNADAGFGLMDTPTDPSGNDVWNFGVWHTSNASGGDIFDFAISGNELAGGTLRIGLLYDGYNGAGSQLLRITQTSGGNEVAQSPIQTFGNTGLDVMFFDLTGLEDGDRFVVYADAVSGISHVSGITFDSQVAVPEPSACAFLLGLIAAGMTLNRQRTRRANASI